jgi:hypothetical protein
VLQDARFRAGIDGGQRIVEQQQIVIGQQRAGDGDALALAAGQRDAFSPTCVS